MNPIVTAYHKIRYKLHRWLINNDTHLCQMTCCFEFAPLNRQNTAYEHEPSNWKRLCEEHQIEVDAYWQERWDEYWSGRF